MEPTFNSQAKYFPLEVDFYKQIVDKIEKGESTVLNSYAYTGTERSFYNLFGYYIVFIVMFFCLIINFDTIKRIYESN